MRISFLGAAREVTGSCYLIDTDAARFLVDCGMFQGGREAPARNRAAFPFDPETVDFVLLTHAHIDHSGLLPRLGREGFAGPVYATPATADLLAIMLRDAAHIQESEAQRQQRRLKGKRRAATPLYTLADAEAVLKQLRPVPYDEPFAPYPGIRVRFRDAGHILGSAILEIDVAEKGRRRKLVFSGDLGQPGRPILRDPTRIEEADVLFVESTYGNRVHKSLADTIEELVAAVNQTLHVEGGNVIVPAFAVGRTQELIYYLHHLTRQGRLRDPHIFVDSPMATAATKVTRGHLALFDEEAKGLAAWHAQGNGLPELRFVASAEESRALNTVRSGAIIIAASGMCDAGRIKHHLRHNLARPESTVLITGFQAQGTLGRRLVDGARRVRIFGEEIPVRARVRTLGGFSAHADQAALLGWLSGFARSPARTFVTHGEAGAAFAFAREVRQRMGWAAETPAARDTVDLDATEADRARSGIGGATAS